MIFHLFRRTPRPAYHRVSLWHDRGAGASAAFYQDYGVPDTVNGRFEMIMLHAVLVLHRLEGEVRPVRRLGQGLFDAFCRDMDASLREMGVGDLAVPRKMRGIGEAFYGRQAAYRAALAAPDEGRSPRRLRATCLRRRTPARSGLQPMCGRRWANLPRRMARRSAGASCAFPIPTESRSSPRP